MAGDDDSNDRTRSYSADNVTNSGKHPDKLRYRDAPKACTLESDDPAAVKHWLVVFENWVTGEPGYGNVFDLTRPDGANADHEKYVQQQVFTALIAFITPSAVIAFGKAQKTHNQHKAKVEGPVGERPAAALWSDLVEHFDNKSTVRKNEILEELEREQGADESLAAYATRLETANSNLLPLGASLDDNALRDMAIHRMHVKFAALQQQYELGAIPKTDTLSGLLNSMREVTRLRERLAKKRAGARGSAQTRTNDGDNAFQADDTPSGDASSGGGRGRGRGSRGRGRFGGGRGGRGGRGETRTCWHCGETGHLKAECPKRDNSPDTAALAGDWEDYEDDEMAFTALADFCEDNNDEMMALTEPFDVYEDNDDELAFATQDNVCDEIMDEVVQEIADEIVDNNDIEAVLDNDIWYDDVSAACKIGAQRWRELVDREVQRLTYPSAHPYLGFIFRSDVELQAQRAARAQIATSELLEHQAAAIFAGRRRRSPSPPRNDETAVLATTARRLAAIHRLPRFNLNKDIPITLVELAGGGTTAFLAASLAAGLKIKHYLYNDVDKQARTCAAHRVKELAAKYPNLLPASALAGWDTTLPADIMKIKKEDWTAIKKGPVVLAAGPPCQGFSPAGRRLNWEDPRSTVMARVLEHIQTVSTTRPNGTVGWVVENVPAAAALPEMKAAGSAVIARAHELGSVARRDTALWSNMTTPTHLKAVLKTRSRTAPTLSHTLSKHKIKGWSARPGQTSLPKFVSRPGSWCFRDGRGGMLLHNGTLAEPCADIREVCMGLPLGATAAHGLSEQQRRHVLGNCIDPNVAEAFIHAAISCEPDDAEHQAGVVWTLDSGCTSHINSFSTEINQMRTIPARRIGGISCTSTSVGTCVLNLHDIHGRGEVQLHLGRVLHVPDLPTRSHGGRVNRLLSQRDLCTEHNVEFHFTKSGSTMSLPDGAVINIEVNPDTNLYTLTSTLPHQELALAAADDKTLRTKVLWHQRLGHVRDAIVDDLSDRGVIPPLSKTVSLPVCRACAACKSTVAPVSREPVTRELEVLEAVGVDIWAAGATSIQGKRYVLGATCLGRSSLTFAEYLATKGEGNKALRRILLKIRRLGFTVKRLRMDNDKVFTSASVQAMCEAQGIVVEYSAPDTPSQNGVQERTWRSIANSVRTMLSHARLDKSYWQFAFSVAVHIHNRTLRTAVKDIPFKLAFNVEPDLTNLRVFGCPAWVHDHRPGRSKLDPNAIECIFVG